MCAEMHLKINFYGLSTIFNYVNMIKKNCFGTLWKVFLGSVQDIVVGVAAHCSPRKTKMAAGAVLGLACVTTAADCGNGQSCIKKRERA